MALVNQVKKVVKMDLWSIVKFQIMLQCYLSDIEVSDADLKALTLLALTGEKELSDFCDISRKNKIFKSEQSARNSVNKCHKENLINKKGDGRKTISINNDSLKLQAEGNILCDFKFIYVNESNKS